MTRSSRLGRLSGTLLAALLAGCASSGTGDLPLGASRDRTTTVQSRTGHNLDIRTTSDEAVTEGLVTSPRDDLWPRLAVAFEALGIEVTYSDPRIHAMGNRAFRVRRIEGKRPAEYLDCGAGPTAQPYANLYEVTMGVIVQLFEVPEGTRATIRIEAAAKPRGVSGHSVPCTSERTLERRILELLQ